MPLIEHPGPLFTSAPKIKLEIPDDWDVIPEPRAAIVVRRRTSDPTAFAANIVVQQLRFAPGHTLQDAASLVDKALDALVEHEDGIRDFGEQFGVPVYVREVSFRHPQAGTLLQHVRVFAVTNGPYVDVVEVTGTASGSDIVEDLPTVRTIADSVSVEVVDIGVSGRDADGNS